MSSGSRRSSRGSASMSEKGIKERLRGLFSTREGEAGEGGARRGSVASLHLAKDKLSLLGPETDLSIRLKQMGALEGLLSTKRLDPASLDALWNQIKDIMGRLSRLSPTVLSPDARAAFLQFLQALATHQLGNGPATEVLRTALFDCIKDSSPGEFGDSDVAVFRLVVTLSDKGTTVIGMEGSMGAFVLKWSEAIIKTVSVCNVRIVDWLAFLQELVKNNTGGLEREESAQLVTLLCVHAKSIVQTGQELDSGEKVEEVTGSLRVLDRLLCFSLFPRGLVHLLVTTLCKLVNAAKLSELSWRVMRNVLCSYLGYTCVLKLCTLLEESGSPEAADPIVLRGAIFFLAMGLWGSQRVEALFYSPVAVLNSLRAGLRADQLIVTYEALISVKRLVDKYGKELQHLSWNGILEILEDIRKSFSHEPELGEKEEKVREVFHLVLDSMEGLAERGSYSGNQCQLYALIESCSSERPEASILRLLSFRAGAINPQCPAWIQDLRELLSNYYLKDGRATVRIKVVNIIRSVYRNNRHLHDAALLQHVVLPILGQLPAERDADVTSSGLQLLADIAKETRARIKVPLGPRDQPSTVHAFRDAFLEIMDVFERLITNGLTTVRRKHASGEEVFVSADDTFTVMDNVENAVKLLTEILRDKWKVSPAYHSLHLLRLLAKVLKLQFTVCLREELGSAVREHIVGLLVHLRANPATTRIGLIFDDAVEENPYLFCHDPALGQIDDYQEGGSEREVGIEWSWIADALITVVKEERVWRVLDLLLVHLPELLKNRALILSTPKAVPDIAEALTEAALSTDKVSTLIGPPETMGGKAEANLADHICPSLGILVAYRDQLERRLQSLGVIEERIVSGIQTALVSGVSVRAVLGWILCIVELPNVVLGMSRDLVECLDKIRKTPAMIIPVFELSSTLLRLPDLYAQFRESDFIHVLDALLPATDTFAFTTFIVAVGHHLVYRWFLKVPIPLRPRIAIHIRRRLEEIRIEADSKGPGGDPQLGKDENVLMDEFLRHYTFTNAPADADQPLPSLLIQLIKTQGWTRHWVQGTRVVSISAVMQRARAERGLLCAKCRAVPEPAPEPADEFGTQRKRHQSAVQGPVTRAPNPPLPTSHDDLHLPRPPSPPQMKPNSICGCWSRGYALIEIRHCFGKSFWVVEINGATVSRLQDASAVMKLSRMVTGGKVGKKIVTVPTDTTLGRARSCSENSLQERVNGSSGSSSSLQRPLNEPLSISVGRGDGEDGPGSRDSSISSTYASAKSTPCPPMLENVECVPGTGGLPAFDGRPGAVDVDVGLNPAWIFAQLFPSEDGSAQELPWKDKEGEQVERSLRNLDRLPPYELHRIGVLYAAPKQTTEAAMLANHCGTERYMRFLDGLGKLLPLKGGDGPQRFTAGLDPNGADGLFTYHWTDPITQVLFHVATLIPTKENDKECRNKKRHLGNDFVTIVYNDSGKEYALDTLSGQYAFVAIVVTPLHHNTLSIKLLAKDEISRWLSLKEAVVSDKEAPLLCRQIGMRSEFSAHCWQSGQRAQRGIRATYISGAMERLLHIRNLKTRYKSS